MRCRVLLVLGSLAAGMSLSSCSPSSDSAYAQNQAAFCSSEPVYWRVEDIAYSHADALNSSDAELFTEQALQESNEAELSRLLHTEAQGNALTERIPELSFKFQQNARRDNPELGQIMHMDIELDWDLISFASDTTCDPANLCDPTGVSCFEGSDGFIAARQVGPTDYSFKTDVLIRNYNRLVPEASRCVPDGEDSVEAELSVRVSLTDSGLETAYYMAEAEYYFATVILESKKKIDINDSTSGNECNDKLGPLATHNDYKFYLKTELNGVIPPATETPEAVGVFGEVCQSCFEDCVAVGTSYGEDHYRAAQGDASMGEICRSRCEAECPGAPILAENIATDLNCESDQVDLYRTWGASVMYARCKGDDSEGVPVPVMAEDIEEISVSATNVGLGVSEVVSFSREEMLGLIELPENDGMAPEEIVIRTAINELGEDNTEEIAQYDVTTRMAVKPVTSEQVFNDVSVTESYSPAQIDELLAEPEPVTGELCAYSNLEALDFSSDNFCDEFESSWSGFCDVATGMEVSAKCVNGVWSKYTDYPVNVDSCEGDFSYSCNESPIMRQSAAAGSSVTPSQPQLVEEAETVSGCSVPKSTSSHSFGWTLLFSLVGIVVRRRFLIHLQH